MKPIIFNTEMVRALLDGRKTVTRRVIKPQPEGKPVPMTKSGCWPGYFAIQGTDKVVRPPFLPGDVLWVRETWAHPSEKEILAGAEQNKYLYRADTPAQPCAWDRWRPSIHMPREATRIFLRVTDVRVERLQDITEDDVCAEGAEPLIQCPDEHPTYGPDGVLGDMCWNTDCCGGCKYIGKTYGELFGELVWDRTIQKHPNKFKRYPFYWSDNPWVWVIEFEKISKEEARKG